MNDLMEKRRAEYQAGNRLALLLAIDTCRAMRWEWPQWIREAVRDALERTIADGRMEDLPARLFGNETPQKQRDAIHGEGLLQCLELLEDHKRRGMLPARANLKKILAEFVQWYAGNPEGVSDSTIGKQLDAARRRRPKVPEFVAIGYEIPLMLFLDSREY